MILRLRQFSYSETETEGVLTLTGDNTKFATVGQPWKKNPNGAKGGLPFHSCVPDGMYQLLPHISPTKGAVYLLFNTRLGVHIFPEHHEKDFGRDLCLLPVGNYPDDVQGCFALGLKRATKWHGVVSSPQAMALLN